MGALKTWMHSIYEDCFAIGVSATAEKYNISEKEVQQTTMAWDGFEGPWEEYVEYPPDGPDDINKDEPIPPQ